jgi:cytochrome c553
MLSATPCAFCHEPTGNFKEAVPEPAAKRRHYEETRDALLASAAKAGLQGDQR